MFCCKGNRQQGIIRPEYLGQHLLSTTTGKRPYILAGLFRQFLRLIKTNGDVFLRFDEQVVFCKKPREKHSVPMFKSTFVNNSIDLQPTLSVLAISQLPGMGAEVVPQRLLLFGHVGVVLGLVDG